MIIQEDNKCGIMDFDGNTVVPAIYHEIHGMSNPLITVRVGEKNNYTEGLIKPDGTVVIPAEYSRISWCRDNYIVCCREGHCELLRYESKKDKGE